MASLAKGLTANSASDSSGQLSGNPLPEMPGSGQSLGKGPLPASRCKSHPLKTPQAVGISEKSQKKQKNFLAIPKNHEYCAKYELRSCCRLSLADSDIVLYAHINL